MPFGAVKIVVKIFLGIRFDGGGLRGRDFRRIGEFSLAGGPLRFGEGAQGDPRQRGGGHQRQGQPSEPDDVFDGAGSGFFPARSESRTCAMVPK